MKLKFYFFCGMIFFLIACKTTSFDQTVPETDSYPDFSINIEEPEPLYALVDTGTNKVYKIEKKGNTIVMSTEEQENNLKEYWIEKIDSLEHRFQIISYYTKERLKRIYNKKGLRKKRKRRSPNSKWAWSIPFPDWSKFDTLCLNINMIESKQVSCELSYFYDTTNAYFKTKGIIKYDQ